ncbi:MAG: porin family protein [Chlorobiaceae bacterium]|nr:porin family protein [Chlorobiaceae bacterium]
MPAYAGVYLRGAAGAGFLNTSDYTYNWKNIVPPGITGAKAITGEDNGHTDFKTGCLVNGAIGYDFGSFRVEGEIGYQNNEIKSFRGDVVEQASFAYPPFNSTDTASYSQKPSGDVKQTILSCMVNLYFDLDLKSKQVRPYVIGGLGNASVSRDYRLPGKTVSFSESVFAWQVGAGLAFRVSNKSTIDIGYRYFATDDVHFNDNHYINPDNASYAQTGMKDSVSGHQLIAGFRYAL